MRTKIMSWPALLTACLLILCGVALGLTRSADQTRAASDKKTQLQVELTSLENEALELRKAIDNVGSDSYVEHIARSTLDYMMPGEMRFEVRNSEMLGNYTEAEVQIINDEKAKPDR